MKSEGVKRKQDCDARTPRENNKQDKKKNINKKFNKIHQIPTYPRQTNQEGKALLSLKS